MTQTNQARPNDIFTGASYKVEFHLQNLLNASQACIDRMLPSDRAQARGTVEQQAISIFAQSRIDHLLPVVQRSMSVLIKISVQVLAIVISGFVFSAGTQVLTARLEQWALPTAIALACIAGFLAEDRATKAVAQFQQYQNARKLLKLLETDEQRHPPINELHQLFLQRQRRLFNKVELEQLSHSIPFGAGLALILSAIEYRIAFFMVPHLQISNSDTVQAIVAALPIALLWLAAVCQAEYFELPQRYAALIERYEPYIFDPEQLSLEEVKGKYAIDARLEFLSKGDPSSRLKNLGMAEAEFKIQYYRRYQQVLQQALLDEIATQRHQFWQTIEHLPDRFLKPSGLSDEEFDWEQNRWINQTRSQLEARLQEEIDFTTYRYQQQIRDCEEKIATAQKQQQLAYQAWCDRRNAA